MNYVDPMITSEIFKNKYSGWYKLIFSHGDNFVNCIRYYRY